MRALWAATVLATAAGQRDPQLARVACDARYSAPCARTNSEFLAWDTARSFDAQLAAGASSDVVLAQITAGDFSRGRQSHSDAAHCSLYG
jgi:hypothetical protein